MPFEVYELLDLGPLKKLREVFTTTDASIVSVAGIAEYVLVKIGQLTIPADFHVIMPTKGDKGGKPQYDEIFIFEVGNVIEIFHLPPPPKPRKKGLHQLQQDKGKKIKDKPWKEEKGRTRKEKKPMINPNHFKKKRKKGKTKGNKGSDQKKKKRRGIDRVQKTKKKRR
ncbi:hypothetical protein PIB30_060468 [Stylosanthes scabra]|uniref:Uncharacterized protein n=1 Tax=Stylosanthes scabra TaxID=79078 RepID=A0ABU6RLC9_9FABA|nr:hypothetical protein [Stylosanthes scabra]